MELSSRIVNLIQMAEQHLCPVYCGVIDRRRVIAYLFLTLIEVVVIPFHFIMFLVHWQLIGFGITLLHLAFFAVVQLALWKHDISFKKAIAALFILVYCKLALDSFACSLMGMQHYEVTVLGNIFIMFILAISALSLMLQLTATIISIGIAPVLAFYLAIQSQDTAMSSLKPIFVGVMMIAFVCTYNMSKVTKGLRQPYAVSDKEQKALDMLANLRDMNYSKAESLWDRLTPQMRKHIISHAIEKLKKEEIDKLAWDMVCVDLTNTEKTICRLVLEGKSSKELCEIMGKNESTITSTRCHIRKKLNMDRKDDLKRTLEMKIAEIRTAI